MTMTRFFVAAATALFLGAFVTEVQTRLFPGQPFVLLLLSVAAIFVGSVVSVRACALVRASAPIRASQPTHAGIAAKSEPNVELEDDRETGRVKWFNRTKGFGFIVRDSGGEVFVHHRNIRGTGRRSLKDGDYVRFKVTTRDKGPQAEEVSVAPEP